MPEEKPRQIAARILNRYAAQPEFLEKVFEEELAHWQFSPSNRSLVKELVFGAVRWQATLDWLIAQKTDGRPQKMEVQILLRLGLYQIFWLERIPEHAAVHETVELAKQQGLTAQARFINAVLRRCLREGNLIQQALLELKTAQPALGYSHPEWLCERWRRRWGLEKLQLLLEWNNTPPPTYARVNTLRSDAEQLVSLWRQEGVHFVPRDWDWLGQGLIFELQAHPPLASLPSFQQGFYYIQDPSTTLAVIALQPQPGDWGLDLCAAPGGKTTLMAQFMRNQGHIVAQEPHPARRDLLQQNCRRLGVTNVQLSQLPSDHRQGFDRIIVDAPCSNTGVMRRRVDVRWRIRPEEIERLRATQLDLLHRAAAQLKPGGTLVYSTCSLEPEENEEVVQEFLNKRPQFWLDYERSLLPFADAVDGAYVARLRMQKVEH